MNSHIPVPHEMYAKFQMVIHWPILSKMCHSIVVQNLSYYISIARPSSVLSRNDAVDLPVLCLHVSYHGKKVVCSVAVS